MSDQKENGLSNPAYEYHVGDEELGKVEGITEKNDTDKDGDTKSIKSTTERAQWGHGLEFLMSCIAMSVGLGNIWRFPFTAKENGGGAFLIPYIIILTVIGRPLYYLEMTLGQFSGKGNVKMYEKLSPVLKVIGFGQLIGSICVATYYCCLMAITLFYLIHSFTGDLPWSTCDTESWGDYLAEINRTCVDSLKNESAPPIAEGTLPISSSEMWFRVEVLRQIDDISEGIGTPDWRLTLCLLGSWVVTFLVSVRGVQSSGKAAYFLALFPYVIMITLLIRAATLPGAKDGMYYFIETDWDKLLDADVWYAAVTQCFFSLNVGFGSIIMYSSYNPFEHNINRDALIVTTLDTLTSLLSGVTIFGILGNLAYVMDDEPANVVSGGGTGLAFISYPDAIAKFDAVPWLFAILFFFMLFVLGIGSLVALQSCANTVIHDSFPKLAMWKISAGTASVFFLIGLIYVTPGGQYMLDLVDHFGGTFIIYVFVLMEVSAACWLYGIEQICLDLEFMIKRKVGIYWRISWGIVMPILLFIIFIYFCATLKPLTYGIYGYEYPAGVLAFGWCILGVGVLQAVIWLGYYWHINNKYSGFERLSKTFTTEYWRPSSQERTDEWRKFKEDKLSKKYPRKGNIIVQKLNILIGR